MNYEVFKIVLMLSHSRRPLLTFKTVIIEHTLHVSVRLGFLMVCILVNFDLYLSIRAHLI
jgi:hypothetical protein